MKVKDLDALYANSKNVSISEIKKHIKKLLNSNVAKIKSHHFKMMKELGKVYASPIKGYSWEHAFEFAQEWNRYDKHAADVVVMKKWIESNKVKASSGLLITNKETWTWNVTLSYLLATPKESPNHQFLKNLLEIYLNKIYPTSKVQREKKETIFYEQIRFDLYCKNNSEVIIGELGGVQLWKVMTSLEKGYTVYVLPHWTTNKTSPFTSIKTEYQYYKFEKGW